VNQDKGDSTQEKSCLLINFVIHLCTFVPGYSLQVYQEEKGQNINNNFHRDMLHALNNLVSLTLKTKGVGDSTEALHKFDQHLQLATTITSNAKDWEPFLNEMKAQLFYHFGTLLLKKPLKVGDF
jgi:hypothetical protein